MDNKYKEQVLHYFGGDELAASVWLDKYALKDEYLGKLIETHPTQMFERLAKSFAEIEFKYRRKEYEICNKTYILNSSKRDDLSPFVRERARVEPSRLSIEREILGYLKNFRTIIPGGSVLSTLGTTKLGSLSNCFVIGQPEDSFNSIFEKRTEQANLMKRRGGVGKDISLLRPKGALVKNVALTSSGAPSFMQVDSEVTREVAMDGRRGALLESISVKHPDILDFIKAKVDKTSVTAANISIKIAKDFMKAVEANSDYLLRWPVDKNPGVRLDGLEYNKLTRLSDNIYVKKVKAREIWNEFIKCSWDSAEPGLLFEDNHIDHSPDGVYEEYKGVSTNPCGEIFMQPYDSCRLIHLNLFDFVLAPFTSRAAFDMHKFSKAVYMISNLADDLVDLEVEAVDRILSKLRRDNDPLNVKEIEMWEKIKQNALKGRRCGIGFTGLGDVLAALGLDWSSTAAKTQINAIMNKKLTIEIMCQIDMAITRGKFVGHCAEKEFYPVLVPSKNQSLHGKLLKTNLEDISHYAGKNSFYEMLTNTLPKELIEKLIKYGRRNVSWNTVAPTGTISLMTQTTSGIEPVFLPFYERSRKVSGDEPFDFTDDTGEKFKKYIVVHKGLEYWWDLNKSAYPEIAKDDWKSIFEVSPYFGNCSADIQIQDRIQIQAIVQRYTTHSISSTLNLPNQTTIEEVDNLFMQAYHAKLKGVTIYRDGSRTGILNAIKEKEDELTFHQHSAPKRPKTLPGFAHLAKSKGSEYTIIVGLLEGKPYEVFAALCPPGFVSQKGTITKLKKGVYQWVGENGDSWANIATLSSNIEERACTLYTSMLLRTGAEISYVTKTAKKVDDNISSFTSALCRVLSKYIPKETTEETCPDCGGKLIREAGCKKCSQCTYSLCLIAYEIKN